MIRAGDTGWRESCIEVVTKVMIINTFIKSKDE